MKLFRLSILILISSSIFCFIGCKDINSTSDPAKPPGPTSNRLIESGSLVLNNYSLVTNKIPQCEIQQSYAVWQMKYHFLNFLDMSSQLLIPTANAYSTIPPYASFVRDSVERKVYFLKRLWNGEVQRIEILGADYDSFTFERGYPPENEYAKDLNQVYFQEQVLGLADVTSFENIVGGFSRDKTNSYLALNLINERTLCQYWYYHYDGFRVFFELEQIPVENIEDFYIISLYERYTTDGKTIFYGSQPTDALVDSFRQIENDWWRDSESLFFEGKMIPNADPNQVKISKFETYAIDSNGVYLGSGWKDLPGRDPETFEELYTPYSKDKNNVYCREFIDPELGYIDNVLVDADPTTFIATSNFNGEDKNNKFSRCEKIP